jgi:hypothetical protein
MTEHNASIPVSHLFTMVLTQARADRHDYVGPFGRRVFDRARGGSLAGAKVNGKVLDLLATDYGQASLDGKIRGFDAYITAQAEDGTIILMQLRGRASPTYGSGQSRVQIQFTVGPGAYEWLNEIQAVGIGSESGTDNKYEVYGLTGAPVDDTPAAPGGDPAARTALAASFLLQRQSQHTPGAERHVIQNPLGGRYLTLAEGGGGFEGPRLSGTFLPGFSWSPHKMGMQNDQPLLHYDVRTLLREADGTPILMSYAGVYSSAGPAGAWLTATLFEVPEGPHDWLNEIQAVGFGQSSGGGAFYKVYALA